MKGALGLKIKVTPKISSTPSSDLGHLPLQSLGCWKCSESQAEHWILLGPIRGLCNQAGLEVNAYMKGAESPTVQEQGGPTKDDKDAERRYWVIFLDHPKVEDVSAIGLAQPVPLVSALTLRAGTKIVEREATENCSRRLRKEP